MENSYHEIIGQKNVEVKQSVIQNIAELFSIIMEEEVTPQQATCIFSIMVAIVLVVFPVVMPSIIRIVALAWLAVSVWSLTHPNSKGRA